MIFVKKEMRQGKIEQLINQQVISNQEELMQALQAIGISATQATISRDIREMQIVKQQDGNGNLRYVIFKANNQSEQDERDPHDTAKCQCFGSDLG